VQYSRTWLRMFYQKHTTNRQSASTARLDSPWYVPRVNWHVASLHVVTLHVARCTWHLALRHLVTWHLGTRHLASSRRCSCNTQSPRAEAPCSRQNTTKRVSAQSRHASEYLARQVSLGRNSATKHYVIKNRGARSMSFSMHGLVKQSHYYSSLVESSELRSSSFFAILRFFLAGTKST
jgi:hypothetical protein